MAELEKTWLIKGQGTCVCVCVCTHVGGDSKKYGSLWLLKDLLEAPLLEISVHIIECLFKVASLPQAVAFEGIKDFTDEGYHV